MCMGRLMAHYPTKEDVPWLLALADKARTRWTLAISQVGAQALGNLFEGMSSLLAVFFDTCPGLGLAAWRAAQFAAGGLARRLCRCELLPK